MVVDIDRPAPHHINFLWALTRFDSFALFSRQVKTLAVQGHCDVHLENGPELELH